MLPAGGSGGQRLFIGSSSCAVRTDDDLVRDGGATEASNKSNPMDMRALTWPLLGLAGGDNTGARRYRPPYWPCRPKNTRDGTDNQSRAGTRRVAPQELASLGGTSWESVNVTAQNLGMVSDFPAEDTGRSTARASCPTSGFTEAVSLESLPTSSYSFHSLNSHA